MVLLVVRDAAENFRGAEKGPHKRREHCHQRNTRVKGSSKCFSVKDSFGAIIFTTYFAATHRISLSVGVSVYVSSYSAL